MSADAPKLLAYTLGDQMVLWCRHCELWHYHGSDGDLESSTGDRTAHCVADGSPYLRSGYVLVYGGLFEDRVGPDSERRRRRRRAA